jgi:peptidoglycan hydrolase-like protein with peptidoglycan-binding domain
MKAADAFTAVNQIVGLTEPEKQYLLTVSMGEGGWGDGWDNPSAQTVKESAQFGLTGHEGKDSKNWGAVQGIGNAGSFFHVDHHADGTVYKGTFKSYKTHTDAALDVAKILLKPNVKAALARGSLHDAVFAQHDNRYFEAAPEQYLKAVLRNYDVLTKTLGWKPLLSERGNSAPPLSPAEPVGGLPPDSSSSEPPTLPNILHETLPTISLASKSSGTAVLLWQRYLKSLGMAVIPNGLFDSSTDSFTRLYQANRNLPSDGIVGPRTWRSVLV